MSARSIHAAMHRLRSLLLPLLLLLLGLVSLAAARNSALFVFGDSLLDAGTAKFFNSNSSSAATSPPYGETSFKSPTGRFSDGKTIADLLAEKLGLSLVRPYLDPDALLDIGANFASSGSRLMGENAGAVSFRTQIQQFTARAGLLRERFGEDRSKTLIREAVLMIAIGSIDVEQAYFPVNSSARVVPAAWPLYVNTLMEEYEGAIRTLYNQGARKVVLMALAPLGCMPAARVYVVRWLPFQRRSCLHILNEMVLVYNRNLRRLVTRLPLELPELAVVLVKPYSLVLNAVMSPLEHGFTDSRDACCGDGLFHAASPCSNTSFLCAVPSTHLFWDSAHLTEAANNYLFRYFWYGDLRVAEPYDLQRLTA